MPVTPFHLGPAYLVKASYPKYFSFRVFLLTQLVIDLESLFFIIKADYPFHRFLHTYVGAFIVGVFCIYPGKYLCSLLSKLWNNLFASLKIEHISITYVSAVIGSFFGVFSHIILDSIMHDDIVPFAPFSKANNLLHVVGYFELHVLCALAGVLGFLIYPRKRR